MDVYSAPETLASPPGLEEVATAAPITGDRPGPITATVPEAATETPTVTGPVNTAEASGAG